MEEGATPETGVYAASIAPGPIDHQWIEVSSVSKQLGGNKTGRRNEETSGQCESAAGRIIYYCSGGGGDGLEGKSGSNQTEEERGKVGNDCEGHCRSSAITLR